MSVNKTVIICIQQSVSSLTTENPPDRGNDDRNTNVDGANQDVDYRSSASSATHNTG